MNKKINSIDDVLSRELRGELVEKFHWPAPVDFGSAAINTLVYGSLKSLLERVDNRGFCLTSFGEENGVRCYGCTHYPRDTAEAARALARFGFAAVGWRILDFSLRNKPRDQYYLPHVYNSDGSIRANTIQVDTPAHLAMAMRACVEAQPAESSLQLYYSSLADIMNATWKNHFHEDWSLLDAGNHNEQFDGGEETLCDLFTNAAMVQGFRDIAWLADHLGDTRAMKDFSHKSQSLSAGIEANLRNESNGGYLAYRRLADRRASAEVNWVNLYAHRWYAGEAEGWDVVYRQLVKNTTICWDGRTIISGDTERRGILGKFFAFLLGYLKEEGGEDVLATHVEFLSRTVRRPSGIYPEWWYYQKVPFENPYWKQFWKKYAGIWESYCDNPQGDYTVDSGNCEQTSVFLSTVMEQQLAGFFQTMSAKKAE